MQISRNLIIIGVLVLVAIIGYSSCKGAYNTAVTMDEGVQKAWSQVENVYQRRADLIPNLVNTVKGTAKFETETLEKVIQARASATQMKVDASNLSPEQIAKFQAGQDGLSSALGRLMVVSEQYPELKSNQSFMKLQDELAGTENRISVERGKFNDSVRDFNSHIRKFPTNLLVGFFGFKEKGYFTAAPGSDKAPDVKF